MIFDTSQTNRAQDWLAPNIATQPVAPRPAGRLTLSDGSAVGITTEIQVSLATQYATQITPPTTRLPFFWDYWDGAKNQPLEAFQPPSPFPGFVPPVLAPASYLLLIDHVLSTGYTLAGTIVTEGNQIPFGWTPTPAVDPQNTKAINAFWAAGPYFMNDGEESRDFFPYFIPISRPKVYWQPAPGKPGFYILTGAGASLGVKNA